ncbi:MAG: hypothetical protein WD314_11185 [Trueperaceae bacterium]
MALSSYRVVRAVRLLLTLPLLIGTLALAQKTVGPIVFASGEADVEPVDPRDRFPGGSTMVYAFFEFENVDADDVLSGVWYLDGEVVLSQATTLRQVLGVTGNVPTGKLYFSISFDEGAAAGGYRLDISLNTELVRSGEFVVEEAATGGPVGEPDGRGDAVEGGHQDGLPTVEHLLFEDDFDDPASGWGTASGETGKIVYDSGRLVITLQGRNAPAVSVHDGIFDDAVIEVQAATLAGPEDNALGIVARYQDNDNYYAFLVSADGYHAVLHFVDGSVVWDQKWELADQGGINRGMAANDLLLLADGTDLHFYVNGNLRGVVRDALWTKGQVGVFAGVFEEPGVQVGFDRWRVWSLPGR